MPSKKGIRDSFLTTIDAFDLIERISPMKETGPLLPMEVHGWLNVILRTREFHGNT
jgi:hypothetical protein